MKIIHKDLEFVTIEIHDYLQVMKMGYICSKPEG